MRLVEARRGAAGSPRHLDLHRRLNGDSPPSPHGRPPGLPFFWSRDSLAAASFSQPTCIDRRRRLG
jgi:hypothetical protein